jgi:hypothetical protein
MDFDDGSTGDSEDETDSLALQYHMTDPSLLGTAVFIKTVDIDVGDSVMVYVHPRHEEPTKETWNLTSTVLRIVLAVFPVISFSLYTQFLHS